MIVLPFYLFGTSDEEFRLVSRRKRRQRVIFVLYLYLYYITNFRCHCILSIARALKGIFRRK